MTDLVRQLRFLGSSYGGSGHYDGPLADLLRNAADEIERLRGGDDERPALARALGPMASQAWVDVETYMELECDHCPEFLNAAERSNLANLILNHMIDAVITQRRSQKE